MISAQIRAILTWEMDDLELHAPADKLNFWLVRAMVGPREGKGEESFDINVCTPKWLEEQVAREGFVLGSHRLFVEAYDPALIRGIITRLIERYSGDSWQDVAVKISRVGQWEFEEYKPKLA